ncbi:hypothetical protein HMH01_07690 [Halovulum dunhuangense]|uniref:Uncharacterized protein n=1 Tax=Halovulum dunhuangense TaxID=1505036 RepID=A0A849L276_9RHOB|nr:hypothetical protein [Halovulum dunhuangense]NNU80321.1 hypothetical protein [Halovulum dunhuangense]
MLRLSCLALLGLIATGARAQELCPPATPAPDPCLAGHWIGQNTAAEAMTAMLERMTPPGTSRVVFPPMPALLGISIYRDGFYVTMPLHQNLSWEDVTDEGSTQVAMDLAIPTAVGRLMTEGDRLSFCTIPPSEVMLRTEAVSSSGGSATTFVSPGMGPASGFAPEMDYYCGGDSLEFRVQLPDPVGPVYYSLRRVPEARLPAMFRELAPE